MNKIVDKYINSLKDKNIHVLGAAGAEGAAIIDFLYSYGIKNITGHDFQDDLSAFRHRFKQTHPTLDAKHRASKLKSIINQDVKLCFKSNYLEGILQADLIFLISSWYIYPPNFPLIKQALDKKIPTSNMTKLYFDLAPCSIIGITGSQGKSTTTALITDILKNAGKNVYTAGNERGIYGQFLDQIENINKNDLIVLEISNRQLFTGIGKSPHIAVITNIYPNHIEEHGSYKNYISTKKNILKYQQKNDFAIINADNLQTKKLLKYSKATTIPFSLKEKLSIGACIRDNNIYLNNKPIHPINEIKLLGTHNLSNILAAIAAVSCLKIPNKYIAQTLKTFTGISHRQEKVAEINEISIIDDLKSTTPTSTISAINSFPSKKIHLIIGGDHKKVSHKKLAKIINKKVYKLYTLPGSTTQSILSELHQLDSKIEIFNHSEIHQLISQVLSLAKKGDIILMSPAGANFQESHLKNKYSLKSIVYNLSNKSETQ